MCCCSIARHKNDPTAKYCQLGTAAIGGGASVRTWVFRGFYEDTGALKFVTDRRSQKIPEIAADPGACVLWQAEFCTMYSSSTQKRAGKVAWLADFFAPCRYYSLHAPFCLSAGTERNTLSAPWSTCLQYSSIRCSTHMRQYLENIWQETG